MKKAHLFFIANLLLACFVLTSCARSRNEVWDDTKSCGRHVKRGFGSLGGKQGDSRQIRSKEEFMGQNPGYGFNDDFIPLSDMDYSTDVAMGDFVTRQAKESPGDPGSSIPGIESFKDPSSTPKLASIFRNLSFPHDSSLIKGQQNLATISNIAEYMREHPNFYLFVEGHCDERGAEAYNLALGARRANAVRNALIQEGVNPDNVFTVSYGKERPLVFGHDEEFWRLNRRAEFKVYHH